DRRTQVPRPVPPPRHRLERVARGDHHAHRRSLQPGADGRPDAALLRAGRPGSVDLPQEGRAAPADGLDLRRRPWYPAALGRSPSSRGPGHRPFTAVTRVRISVGTPPFYWELLVFSCAGVPLSPFSPRSRRIRRRVARATHGWGATSPSRCSTPAWPSAGPSRSSASSSRRAPP